ncbi:major facilitator superfamily domain-containing protein [Macrophomina phaseolina]|uniref:Major facilitator superfamily domain-containing protein n=1 Tax=Macrophomina phaseolina TaxID=35725 RepID=A0ABQ8GND8_9PEZI|nr:major facilitator superfamily domain-containing protein [Macrophomina phaseolina]
MIPFGAGISVTIPISEDFGISRDLATWIAASYPLTQGAFVIAGGRIGAIFGHKQTLICAAAWWVLWSLVSGFMRNITGLSFARGLTGAGGAFLVPNAVALININLPPGKERNVAMGLFGAMAPIGAAGGSVFAGIFAQLTHWKRLFAAPAMLGAVVFGISAVIVPSDKAIPRDEGSVDWLGAYLGIGGLILFNFVWNQAPSAGWEEPYEYSILIVAVLHLIGFVLWEKYVAKDPILPFDIWGAPSFPALILVSLMAFMSFGVLIWYISLWPLTIRHWSLLLVSAAIVPLTVFGAVAAILSAWLMPRLAAQYILAIGAICVVASSTLVATMPAQQSYWAQLFPAAPLMAFCPDFIFTAAQIIVSNSVKREQQGIAGSLIGTLATYGQSIGLGFAGTVEKYTTEGENDLVQGYRNALYFGIGLGVATLILDLLFVRVEADRREGWAEEGQDNVIP